MKLVFSHGTKRSAIESAKLSTKQAEQLMQSMVANQVGRLVLDSGVVERKVEDNLDEIIATYHINLLTDAEYREYQELKKKASK